MMRPLASHWAALLAVALGASCGDPPRSDVAAPDPPVVVDWPRYRLKLDNSGFNDQESTLGPDNVGTLRLAWQFQAEGAVWGSPAVAGERVVFGDHSGTLWVVDKETGTLEQRLTFSNNQFLGGAYATPAIEGDDLYYQDPLGNMFRYDLATRTSVWRQEAEPNNAGFSSPALWEGLVIAGFSNGTLDKPCTVGKLKAFDKATGALVWEWAAVPRGALGGGIWNSPAIDEGRGLVFAATANPPNGNSLCGRPIRGDTPGDYTDSIVALDARTGRLRWAYQAIPGDTQDLDFSGSSCLLFNDGTRDLVAAGGKDGRYYAVERDSGRLAWISDLRHECGDDYDCGGVFSPGGFAYGKLYLNVGFPQPGRGEIPPSVVPSATVALDPRTGAVLWKVPGERAQLGGAAIANGMVFIGNGTDLMVVRASDGSRLFAFHTGSEVWSTPAVVNGAVYFGSNDHRFYTLELP